MKEKLEKIKLLYSKGFFHIIGSNILNKIMQFCSGIFIVRVLTKEEFGVFSYAQNLLAFFLLINGLGITTGFLQYGSRNSGNKELKNSIANYSLKYGVGINILISFLIVIYSIFGKFKVEEARIIFRLMLFFPIITLIIEMVQIYLRINLKNKEMAKIFNLNTFFNLIGMLLGGYIYGIIGLVVGKYIGNLISIFNCWKYLKIIYLNNMLKIGQELKKEMIKFSIVAVFNNGISQLLYIMDIFLIGIIIADKNIIASYKTATLIPFALNFIPLSIMTYLYPYIVKNIENKFILKGYLKQLLIYLGGVNLIISTILILFSKLIITIIFGKNYLDSKNIFIMLSIGYFIAGTFRIPFGNLLAAMGKIKCNFYTTLFSGILNIILDMILIKRYGSIGAATATISIFIFSSILGGYFLYKNLK
ncbi:oligosaccharide flippase family protein [Fusobacterium mortiferum]|uniref:oligosaccharide flippase family protein n=1 Tax=Fusobacterium mortiferum TaxID=850 RepID=UPI00158C0B51|nr:oligosaccharide flippase family protein [Fusobacterium mortiferum]